MMEKTTHFWGFSQRIYLQPGVEQSCLTLQDYYGCDVNLLLFCYWGGVTFGVIDEEIINKALCYSKHWRSEVVQPLRDARKWMKGREWITASQEHDKLRDLVKSAELESERLQHSCLEQLTCSLPAVQFDPEEVIDAIIENLDRYLRRADIKTGCSACDNLATILYTVVSSINLEVIRIKLKLIVKSC